MKKVLITGATGQIGHRLCLSFSQQGFEVVGISRKKPPVGNINTYKHITFDLMTDNIEMFLEYLRPQLLIHLAWETKPNIFWLSSTNYLWTQKSIELIKSFWHWGGEKIFVSGTCAEYDWRVTSELSETSAEFPETPYGKGKLNLLNFLRAENAPFLWTRTFFQFGRSEMSGRLIPSLIDAFWRGDSFQIDRPEDIRDFIYVDDVAEIMSALIFSGVNGIFNVGSGEGIKVRDLALQIASKMDQHKLLKFRQQIEEQSVVKADISKIRDTLRLFSLRSLDEALEITIQERRPL